MHVLDASARRALDNARCSADALHSDVETRRRLAPVAETRAGQPGELTRIPTDECLQLLRGRKVGRLAYVPRQEGPDIVPVNYVVDDADRILIRTGPGPKLLAAGRRAVVAFEVDNIDEDSRTGWSVVVTARAAVVERREGAAVQPWATGPRDEVICLQISRVDGRRLT